MSEETAVEREQRIDKEAAANVQEGIDKQRSEAEAIIRERHAEGPHFETQEEYAERVAAGWRSGVFGDLQVPVATVGGETVPVTEVGSEPQPVDESGEPIPTPVEPPAEVAAEPTPDPAVEPVAETPAPTAEPAPEPVVAPAETPVDSNGDGESDADQLSRTEKIDAIKAAGSADEVDAIVAGDQRKTVTDAADARKAELSA